MPACLQCSPCCLTSCPPLPSPIPHAQLMHLSADGLFVYSCLHLCSLAFDPFPCHVHLPSLPPSPISQAASAPLVLTTCLVTASWYAPSEASTSSTGPTPVNVHLVTSSDASDSSVSSTCSGSGDSGAAVAKSTKPAPAAVHAPPAHRAAAPPVSPRACRRPLVLSAYDGVLDPELFEKTGELGRGGFGTVVAMWNSSRLLVSEG
ncbi:unnamed protein product [Closterium sp. NIES-54]